MWNKFSSVWIYKIRIGQEIGGMQKGVGIFLICVASFRIENCSQFENKCFDATMRTFSPWPADEFSSIRLLCDPVGKVNIESMFEHPSRICPPMPSDRATSHNCLDYSGLVDLGNGYIRVSVG